MGFQWAGRQIDQKKIMTAEIDSPRGSPGLTYVFIGFLHRKQN